MHLSLPKNLNKLLDLKLDYVYKNLLSILLAIDTISTGVLFIYYI